MKTHRFPQKYAFLTKRIVELGALEAKLVSPRSVVTAGWVRLKCKYGCDGYGSSLCCPPNTPTSDDTRKVLDDFQAAVLAHFKPGSRLTKSMVSLEREAFLSGFYKAFAFGAGPCNLCKSCPASGCRHPDKARPSMESCGIDVYSTARNNGFPIEVVRDEHSQRNYYGLLLVE